MQPEKPTATGPGLGSRLEAPVFALSGAGAGLALGLGLSHALTGRLVYQPYDGILGLPAFLDYSPTSKIAGYLLVTALSLLGMTVAGLWARTHPEAISRRTTVGLVCLLGLFSPILAVLLGWAPSSITDTLLALARLRRAQIELVAGFAVLGWLVLPAFRIRRSKADISAPEVSAPFPQVAELSLLVSTLWLLLQPLAPSAAIAFSAALIFGGLALVAINRRALLPGEKPLIPPIFPQKMAEKFEALAWAALALAPLAVIVARVGLALDESFPARILLGWTGPVAFFAALWAADERRRAGGGRMVSPYLFLPISAAALYLGAGGPAGGGPFPYDPYHQGEHIYASRAMSEGLLPYRDIFFVHGLGFNWLPGWIAGGALDRAPNMDLFVLSSMGALGIVLMSWFYLKLWGGGWWLLALTIAATTAGGVNRCARFLPIYVLAHLALAYVRGGSGAWLAAAGFVSAIAIFFSVDIGAIALAGGALWAALHGLAVMKGRGKLRPLAFFAAGAAAAACLAAALLASAGVLRDFIGVHLDYIAIKQHYDNLPFPATGVAYWAAPALSILAIGSYAVAHFRPRQGEDQSPPDSLARPATLWSIVLLFALLNYFAYMRGLDRSDEGHLYYSSLLAWPLFGCLIAMAGARLRPAGQLFHSALASAIVLALPYASPPVGGGVPPLISGIQMLRWYRDHSDLPMTPRKKEMPQEFFNFCEALAASTHAGDSLFDLTNQPALFRWVPHLRCPTRFYSAFYPSSMGWQDEVIAALKDDETPWVLWPGERQTYLRVDQIDQRARLWKIAAHVRRRYAPAREMPDGSLLLARADRFDKPPPILWRDEPKSPIEFGKIPFVWGRSNQGAPPPPPVETVLADDLRHHEGNLPLDGAQSEALARADELWIESKGTEKGAGEGGFVPLELTFADSEGAANARIVVAFRIGHPCLYRVPIGGLWKWNPAPTAAVSWKMPPAPGTGELSLRLSARGAGHN